MPDEPEIMGLLALMLLHNARGRARVSPAGEMILLPDQDRSLWDQAAIGEGTRLVEVALRRGRPGPYQVQAAIAAIHAQAPSAELTDCAEIALLYAFLNRIDPSPVVELNRAVAVAMVDGPAAGLAIVDQPQISGPLASYRWLHSTRGDLLRRLGRIAEAAAAYARALDLSDNRAERAFLSRRLQEVRAAVFNPTLNHLPT